MWLIGRRCKCGNVLSWPILIGRGLDLNNYGVSILLFFVQFLTHKKWVKTPQGVWHIFGGNSKEVTPVPIPNTVVKLFSADDTWWATARESKTLPEHTPIYRGKYSSLAQSVERMTVNHDVAGSSPAGGARLRGQAVKTPPFHGGNRGSIPLGQSRGRFSWLRGEIFKK